jgi:hypothetical protein
MSEIDIGGISKDAVRLNRGLPGSAGTAVNFLPLIRVVQAKCGPHLGHTVGGTSTLYRDRGTGHCVAQISRPLTISFRALRQLRRGGIAGRLKCR